MRGCSRGRPRAQQWDHSPIYVCHCKECELCLRQVESKGAAYTGLKRIAAQLASADRALTVARSNSAGRPEDGHEQDGKDSSNTVEHHLGQKTVEKRGIDSKQ